MAWGKKDKPKSNYAMNMSLRQQARRAAAEGVRSDVPKNFAELEPKGPLGANSSKFLGASLLTPSAAALLACCLRLILRADPLL